MGEKRHSKTIKTVHSTSQVLIVKVLSNNELKPEKALRRSSCVKCFKLCCYSFWQWVPRNDECAKPNSLYMEFCQDIRIMVAERKRVSKLVRLQHTRGCPSPVLPLREGTGSFRTKLFLRRNNPDAV